jgi:hypothetical protein
MSETISGESGGVTVQFQLDFETMRWSSPAPHPAEGMFPFIAHSNGRRYELYSDETFDEVEDD